jgi:pilus assembly protein CpaC
MRNRNEEMFGELMNPAFGAQFGVIAGPLGRTRSEWRSLGSILCAAALGLGLTSPLPAQPGTQELKLTVGKSVVIDYPSDIGRISTSNPDAVDAVPITAREILINAKANGQSTLVVWSKSGERSFFAVTVDQNIEPIQKLLKDTFPSEEIELRTSQNSASLNGKVSSQLVADRAVALVAPMVKTVVNNLAVLPGPVEKQVILHVKFASLDRSRATSFGFNLLSTGAANTPGRITTGQFPSGGPSSIVGTIGGAVAGTVTNVTVSDALNIFAFRPDLNLGALIKALQSDSILQILAEPNLVTTNGREASFLAGGEFPVPILQGGGNAGAITIQFREYGIRLSFLPVITTNGTIKMHIRQELSTIDLTNAVVLSGFTIPALSTRKTETDVELGEGQSFAIAGLIDERATVQLSKIPGLANIPILGALFKSNNKQKSKTELVVMVTPESIMPYLRNEPKPEVKMPYEPLPDNSPLLRELTTTGHPTAKP